MKQIEKLKLLWEDGQCIGGDVSDADVVDKINEIVDVLNSQLEKHMDFERLDEAARNYTDSSEWTVGENLEHIDAAFKAGAGWRKAQLPKLPDSLNEAAEEYSNHFSDQKDKLYAFHGFRSGAEWRNKQISKLSSNLDEAAEKYERDGTGINKEVGSVSIYDAFKAGAEWAFGQGIVTEQTVDRTPLNGPDGIMVHLYDFDGFKHGDKVIVQIRKNNNE